MLARIGAAFTALVMFFRKEPEWVTPINAGSFIPAYPPKYAQSEYFYHDREAHKLYFRNLPEDVNIGLERLLHSSIVITVHKGMSGFIKLDEDIPCALGSEKPLRKILVNTL